MTARRARSASPGRRSCIFRPLFTFFLVELGSRRVAHVGVTRHPTDTWVAQQLREATTFGERSQFLVRDNDGKYGACFTRLAGASGITVLRTPVRAPRANAITERFLSSVRRECLDQLLLVGEAHLRWTLGRYFAYFNEARPHQGLGQCAPAPATAPGPGRRDADNIVAIPVLGGLHHTYQRAA